ncbi:hypothetical protein ACNF40_07705 [Cuniculiplasma sp. SKW4]|uniref:hypothetical protein n=1 Tax=Cuniculiplasma sp. SKW4 TaxID=3400171 RepID=UPI003FD2CF17
MDIIIEIRDDEKILQIIEKACSPDNGNLGKFIMKEGTLEFHTKTQKIGNIYSLTDEVLKCYELIKKLVKDYS